MRLPQRRHGENGVRKVNAIPAIHPERKRKRTGRSRPIALLLDRAYTAGSDRCSSLTRWPIYKSATVLDAHVRGSGCRRAFALGELHSAFPLPNLPRETYQAEFRASAF